MIGILLAAVSLAGCFGLTCSGVDEITAATKVGRSRAYELRRGVLEAAQALLRPVGRPRAEPEPEDTGMQAELSGAVLTFLAENPGSMYRSGRRRFYADEFRRFVLELRERHAAIDLPTFARATHVPLGTLDGWLRAGKKTPAEATTTDSSDTTPPTEAAGDDAELAGDRAPDSSSAPTHAEATTDDAERTSRGELARVEMVIVAWRVWKGDSTQF